MNPWTLAVLCCGALLGAASTQRLAHLRLAQL